jgi:hypothetical protein
MTRRLSDTQQQLNTLAHFHIFLFAIRPSYTLRSLTFVSTHQRRTDFGCTITLPAQKLKQPPPAPTVSDPPFVARQVQ